MKLSEGFARRAALAWEQGRPWSGLGTDAAAYALAQVARDTGALLVVDEPDRADRLVQALRVFAEDRKQIELYPSDDTQPWDGFSPAPERVARRLRVLQRLEDGEKLLVVAPVRALMQRIPDAATRALGTKRIRTGECIERDALISHLSHAGYLAVSLVQHPGSFAVRGDVVDVWSAGISRPVRIDWFDDEIESIRVFDPSTGRTRRNLRQSVLLPAREERIDPEAIARFSAWSGQKLDGSAARTRQRRRDIEAMRAGVRFSAIEDSLPALVPTQRPSDVLGLLPVVLLYPGSVWASAREFERKVELRYEQLGTDDPPWVTPRDRFEPVDALEAAWSGARQIHELSGSSQAEHFDAAAPSMLAVRGTDFAPVVRQLRAWADKGYRVAIFVQDARRTLALEEIFANYDLELTGRAQFSDVRTGEIGILVGDLPTGFVSEHAHMALIPASALFGHRGQGRTLHTDARFDVRVGHIGELRPGDLVVHKQHGIGRFEGLSRLEFDGSMTDFAKVAYRGDDVLYVPVTALGQLSRYAMSGDPAQIKLDKLGGQTWLARTSKVRDQLLKSATELMATAAKREILDRPPHPECGPLYRTIEARFPWVETPDQAKAILDVHEDLSSERPMDRLLCGDVGFGKTEVAMRAAMRVVEGGRQVLFLCPTTVLAFQHHLTLKERFADLPVQVGMLSRFTPPAEAQRVREGLSSGQIDIVVGTHALLSHQVRFSRLGLVIVDEEHRFGVKQKERIKRMRAEVDVLSMSATPIPRTLQMALSGIRPMSVMTTPPAERLEVRTSLAKFSETRVRDAILTELARDGQVFVVHNRIEDIEALADTLASWVPEARVRVAHGKLSADALEALYLDFVQHNYDVLVSTTIIETGVDLPNVNTMLIHQADRYGLGQLYQLRGRVGRGALRGTCLLMVDDTLSSDARRRLGVLVENTRLGSGLAIAAADLELRGGGNLLGDAQSGNIDQVGYHVWVSLLEEAIERARGRADFDRIEPDIEVPSDAFIPEEVMPDISQRMAWYQRFSSAEREVDVESAIDDLRDAYGGDLPFEVHNLGGKMTTTIWCRTLGITRVAFLRVRVSLDLHPHGKITPDVLTRLLEAHPKRFSTQTMPDHTRLDVRFAPSEREKPWIFLRWVMARLDEALRQTRR